MKEDLKTKNELKSDADGIISTADKGVALVVIYKCDSIRKIKELLEDTNTYRHLNMDSTNKQKDKLINCYVRQC